MCCGYHDSRIDASPGSTRPASQLPGNSIVPAQRAPFASARPRGHLLTRWIEAKHVALNDTSENDVKVDSISTDIVGST
jgi:hypothetical protein